MHAADAMFELQAPDRLQRFAFRGGSIVRNRKPKHESLNYDTIENGAFYNKTVHGQTDWINILHGWVRTTQRWLLHQHPRTRTRRHMLTATTSARQTADAMLLHCCRQRCPRACARGRGPRAVGRGPATQKSCQKIIHHGITARSSTLA